MSSPPDFGYDHDVKYKKPQMVSHMQQLGLNFNPSALKYQLLPILEKHYAVQRERLNQNPKEYLAPGYNPSTSGATKAQLRQILSQYDIPYPASADRTTLAQALRANLYNLRRLNNQEVVPQAPETDDSPAAIRVAGRAYRTRSTVLPSPPASSGSSTHNTPASRSTSTHNPPRSRDPSTRMTAPSPNPARSTTADPHAPESISELIKETCALAVWHTEHSNPWMAKRLIKRLLDRCAEAVTIADEEDLIKEEGEEQSEPEEENQNDDGPNVDWITQPLVAMGFQ